MNARVKIHLTKGQVTVIDCADDYAVKLKWFALFNGKLQFPYYAARNKSRANGGTGGAELLHRVIMSNILGRELTDDEQVDHRDGDGLNNTRENLRLATCAENQRNKGRRPVNTSGYIGVCWHKQHQKWAASLASHGRRRHLGLFSNIHEAVVAYDRACYSMNGDFAVGNYPRFACGLPDTNPSQIK